MVASHTPMHHHLSFAVSDIGRSAQFYDAVFPPLGYSRVWTKEKAVGYGIAGGDDNFAILLKPGVIKIPEDGFHVAFAAPSREAISLFYKAALAHGGSDNGGSGHHPEYGPNYFAAFVFDPDGYRIEAVIDEPV
jgi:catechol 2,3-dioxygenase-like lactoylglutathione lyase family enzyme